MAVNRVGSDRSYVKMLIITCIIKCVCVCFLMPTHCTITHFGFHARRIDDIKCGLFSYHAPLEQTTLCFWDKYLYTVGSVYCRKLRLG